MRLTAPVEAYWWMTSRCNLGCTFCFAEGGRPYPAGELDEAGRAHVADELASNRVLKVVLSGGEPMLLPDVYDITGRLCRAGAFVELTTNATLVGHGEAARLKEAGLKRAQISMNGLTSGVNDGLMGVSHGLILRGLDALIAAGIPVSAKLTAARANLRELPGLAAMLVSRGVERVKVADPVPMGRAYTNEAMLVPGLEEYEHLELEIDALGLGEQVSFGSFRLAAKRHGKAFSCGAADPNNSRMVIMPDGSAAPCTPASLWPTKLFIAELGLKGSWERFGGYARYLDADRLEGRCASCASKWSCMGGCRPLGYLYTGSIWGEYPLCPVGGMYAAEKEGLAKAVA